MAAIVIDEINLVGSRCGPFDKAISAIAAYELQLDNFVSGRFPIESFEAAFARAQQADALKVILEL